MSIQDFLKSIAASPAAIEFSNGKTLKEVWETCDKGDWLFFLIRKLDFPNKTFDEIAAIASSNGDENADYAAAITAISHIIRNHIHFDQVAQAARQKRIDC